MLQTIGIGALTTASAVTMSGFVDGVPRRVLMLDRITWEYDWPVVGCTNTPSRTARAPGSELLQRPGVRSPR
ncbi:hypothetical protein [Natrinema sp. 1APR25-10V2]|uniref:hypothetical protein n=1 Tax=Natrinema sp. 1APR25-10V2 TaxID=2951081 RepID=UPI00287BB446|nr:hypothetical protein [Natrinema sp. 1APR25-10V2]